MRDGGEGGRRGVEGGWINVDCCCIITGVPLVIMSQVHRFTAP